MSNPEVLCFGETMGVITPASTESFEVAQHCHMGYGGAESNVATHLGETGFKVAWASRLGKDPVGNRILVGLTESGVDTGWVLQDDNAATGIYLKEPDTGNGSRAYYYRSGSAAASLSAQDAMNWPMDDLQLIHTSGINAALSDSCLGLLEFVLKTANMREIPVSFDVNYRPALWPVEKAAPQLLTLARQADIVLVGLDEAEILWGCQSAEDVANLLLGPSSIVVKDSSNEAVEFINSAGENSIHRVAAAAVDVVEPVGAGDAFAAGYLIGFLQGDSPENRLRLGHSFAAWTLQSRSDIRSGHGSKVRTHPKPVV